MLKDSTQAYGGVTKIIHWLLAICVLTMLTIGIIMTSIDDRALKIDLYFFHKSLGLTVLGLMIIFVLWRFWQPKPQYPTDMPSWEVHAARIVHGLLYVLLIAMPLSGWIMSTAAGHVPNFFGLGPVPTPFIPENRALAGFFNNLHTILAWTVGVVLTIHILAALAHHFIQKDGILKRMMGFGIT